MATKKATKKTAKVELDAATVDQFESALRDGLVASGAVMMSENKASRLVSRTKVELDPATTARLSEILRKGLVASHARMAGDNKALDDMTKKVKSPRPRPRSKKR